MSQLIERLDRTLYPDHGDNWDDHLFRGEILARLCPEDEVLDLLAFLLQ